MSLAQYRRARRSHIRQGFALGATVTAALCAAVAFSAWTISPWL